MKNYKLGLLRRRAARTANCYFAYTAICNIYHQSNRRPRGTHYFRIADMIYTILFILTLILSAFFSSSETAFVAANRLKLRILYYDADSGQSTRNLLQSDQRFLTATLVGNNIMVVACSSLAVVVFSTFVSSTALVFVTTGFLLLVGEILPKSIATQMPNRLLRLFLGLLNIFYIIFYPIILLTEALSRIIVRIFQSSREQSKLFSKFELPVLVRQYASTTIFDGEDQLLLSRSLRFREKRIWDIMIPRTDVVGVEFDATTQNVVKTFMSSGFSRLPVYENNMDQVKGVYYVLDFIDDPRNINDLIRPALFLPESMNAMEALRKFQNEKVSIAIAVDEHGGTAGLLTLENIIEKLVGAIDDEFDTSRFLIRKTGKSALIADGRITIDELRENLDIILPEGEYVTIAGLIEEKLGRVARAGESVDLPDYKLKVLEATHTKIIKVWIIKKPTEQKIYS